MELLEKGVSRFGWASKEKYALGPLSEEGADHPRNGKVPPGNIDEYLLGHKLRVVILKQLKDLIGGLPQLPLAKPRRVLKVVHLHYCRYACRREVKASHALLQRLNHPPYQLVPLLLVPKCLVVQLLVLKLTEHVVVHRVPFFVVSMTEHHPVPINSKIFLDKTLDSEFLSLTHRVSQHAQGILHLEIPGLKKL